MLWFPQPPQRRKTPQQVRQLEEIFFGPSRQFDPTARADQAKLAKAVSVTGLTMKQVRQWFQYKRQKARPGGKYGSSTSGLSEAVLAFKVGGSARGL